MGAPLGNRFWEQRSKHGRERIFATAEIMWEAAQGYFAWCEDHPLIEIDFVGKDATKVEKPKMRAFTWDGLCLFLDCNRDYFTDFEDSIKGKDDTVSKDYSRIITRIRATIFTQKFTGAAAGFLKENIIARELGLKDSSDLTSGGDKIGNGISVTVVPPKEDDE